MGTGAEEPYPSPPTPDWQAWWIDAVLAEEGANVPRDALENIAPFIVQPKNSITPAANGVRRLRAGIARRIHTEAGELLVVDVRMHGVGGVVWEHNERISSTWRSAADPASAGEQTQQSRVRPWIRTTEDGREVIFSALESTAPDRRSLVARTERAASELDNRDGRRSYDLKEDLVLNGQQEPCLYVPQQTRLTEPPPEDSDGRPLHPGAYWGWMAVRGNNRTWRRQQLFDVSSAEVLTGVPFKKLAEERGDISVNPAYWLKALSRRLNQEYAEAVARGDHDAPAVRAHRVAEVGAQLVIGCPTPQRLYRIVQGSNRREHIHPPLEFTSNDRGRALGRTVLGVYVADGIMDELTADVLSGGTPVRELPGVAPDATVSELRDHRSMLLLTQLFPTEERQRNLIRRALSEGVPSKLTGREVHLRARAWSAMTSESYPAPWNPRIAESFKLKEAREGFSPSPRRLPELLKAADTDDEAFDELIAFRAAHWLAAFDIIDADRGSLTGQKTDDDDGTKAERVRRTVTNSLNALRKQRRRAVGLLREIASSMDEEDRSPRKVDDQGRPYDGLATRAWFNRTFPKADGTRSYQRRGEGGATDAVPLPGTESVNEHRTAPTRIDPVEETPKQAVGRLARELGKGVGDVKSLAGELKDLAIQLNEQANEAGMDHPLSREQAEAAVLGLTRSLAVLRKLPEQVQSMAEPE